jgi:glycosyltransferase involved in cell wall biosynthesis
MKKILFMSPLPPPHYGSAISSEMCLNILKDVKEFEVRHIKLNYSKSINDIGEISFAKIWGLFYVLMKAFGYKLTFKPDIIYIVPSTADMGLVRDSIMVKLLRSRRSKLIVHFRSKFVESDFLLKRYRYFMKNLLNTDRLVLIGEELIKNLNGYGDKSKIVVLPNAIPCTVSDSDYMKYSEERYLNSEKLRLIFLSNMIETKGWFKTLESCAILKNKGLNFICHFVGDWMNDDDVLRFNAFVLNNELENYVKHHGKLLGEEKNQVLRSSDILIFPTEYKVETFGRVIVEAMEYGIPVIANGIASIPSIIDDGQTGFVLKENTSMQIASKVLMLSEADKRKEFGKKSRVKFLRCFTEEVFKPNFIKLFHFN